MKTTTYKFYLLFLLLLGTSSFYSNNSINRFNFKENPVNAVDLSLRIGLYNSSQNPGLPGASSLDGIILQFSEDFSNCDDGFDADKIFGPDENIYTTVDGNIISIQSRRTPSSNFNEIIDLSFTNLVNPQYKLYFEFLNDSGLSEFVNGIYLWDKCENTYTSVSDLEVITFDLSCSASNPFYGERFALVFKQNPLVNDNAFNAIELPVDQASAGDEFTTFGATAENNEPSTGLKDGINGSVWFSFLAPVAGNVKISTDIAGGTADDTEIAVYGYDGLCSADFSNFNRIAYDDDSGSLVPGSSTLYLENLNEGERYFIQVDGTNSSTPGTFGVEIRSFTVFTYNTLENYLPFDPNGESLSESVLIIQDGIAVIDQITSLREVIVKPNGILDLNANINANILFESNTSGSGQLAEITSATINGEVTAERFIPAGDNDRRAYRLLTSAVNSSGSINANWQEGATTEDETANPNPGFGTHITGGDASLGFDQNGSGNPSMFTFNNDFEATGTHTQANAWQALPDTNSKTLLAGEAYLTFIRGDRGIDVTNNSSAPTNTILRAKGDLYIGSRSFSSANNVSEPAYGLSTVEDYFSLVGNPYQAIVDMNNLDFNNVNPNAYWVWDPKLGTRGNYATVSLPAGTNTTSSPANQFVQPGQSFFVQTLADGTASLTFNEDDKSVSGGTTEIFSEQDNSSIKILLYTSSAFTNGDRETDGLLINFSENANNDIDQFDADKFQGPDESLARLHGTELISIENRAIPQNEENLRLSITGYNAEHYTFVVNAINIQDNFEGYLMDNYTGTSSQLNEGVTAVNFIVDTNIPQSIAEDRFSLVFDNTALSINESTFGENFSLYPNPTKGQFSIFTPGLSGAVNVEISNLLGQQLYKQVLNIDNQEVNVKTSRLASGIYIVKLAQGNQSFTTKLIVE